METIILASGSKGNALVVKNGTNSILIDIGISYLSYKQKLSNTNIKISSINYLLITHEHSDHIRGLKTFIKNHPNITVFMTNGTYLNIPSDVKLLINNLVIINQDDSFEINAINVTSFALSHDANEPVGYVLESNNKKIVLATDTGYLDESYFALLSKADLYILESNHCTKILMDSNRPFYLKQRILSQKGHLSNEEAAWLINNFIKDIKSSIWAIAHISEDCNTIASIKNSISEHIDKPKKLKLIYTSQETSEVIKI